jgi:hypothetical protein
MDQKIKSSLSLPSHRELKLGDSRISYRNNWRQHSVACSRLSHSIFLEFGCHKESPVSLKYSRQSDIFIPHYYHYILACIIFVSNTGILLDGGPQIPPWFLLAQRDQLGNVLWSCGRFVSTVCSMDRTSCSSDLSDGGSRLGRVKLLVGRFIGRRSGRFRPNKSIRREFSYFKKIIILISLMKLHGPSRDSGISTISMISSIRCPAAIARSRSDNFGTPFLGAFVCA